MLDIRFIRNNPDTVATAIRNKMVSLDLNRLLEVDQLVQKIRKDIQDLQTQRNKNAAQTKAANASEKGSIIENGRNLAQSIDLITLELDRIEKEFDNLMLHVPNIPAPDAPVGTSEEDNREIKQQGQKPSFGFSPKSQTDLLQLNGWAEFERIREISGSRNYSLCGDMVLLEMALLRFALDKLKKKNFKIISVPTLCREEALVGTGHFPTGREQNYFLPDDNLYLAGTAEVIINSLHRNEILREEQLPILYAGISPCFRREAGSSGKDVKGLIRVHQFYKVEQFVLCRNDITESEYWCNQLLQTSEEILNDLELPYRVVETCTADMGVGKYRMRDIETWVPSENKYRETHSCSILLDWQARRTNLRYRNRDGEVMYCHTLNNTAVATPRILVPLIENHQTSAGAVRIPKALQPYMGVEVLSPS